MMYPSVYSVLATLNLRANPLSEIGLMSAGVVRVSKRKSEPL